MLSMLSRNRSPSPPPMLPQSVLNSLRNSRYATVAEYPEYQPPIYPHPHPSYHFNTSTQEHIFSILARVITETNSQNETVQMLDIIYDPTQFLTPNRFNDISAPLPPLVHIPRPNFGYSYSATQRRNYIPSRRYYPFRPLPWSTRNLRSRNSDPDSSESPSEDESTEVQEPGNHANSFSLRNSVRRFARRPISPSLHDSEFVRGPDLVSGDFHDTRWQNRSPVIPYDAMSNSSESFSD